MPRVTRASGTSEYLDATTFRLLSRSLLRDNFIAFPSDMFQASGEAILSLRLAMPRHAARKEERAERKFLHRHFFS